jgi:hypothetical protein
MRLSPKNTVLAVLLAAAPAAAFAMPSVGDSVGTDADSVKAALAAAGCTVDALEVEKGKVEAKCTETATGKAWEVYIDPATGKVADLSDED